MSLAPLFHVLLLLLLLFDTSSPDSNPLLLIATILFVHHAIGLLLAARGNNSPAKLKLVDECINMFIGHKLLDWLSRNLRTNVFLHQREQTRGSDRQTGCHLTPGWPFHFPPIVLLEFLGSPNLPIQIPLWQRSCLFCRTFHVQ